MGRRRGRGAATVGLVVVLAAGVCVVRPVEAQVPAPEVPGELPVDHELAPVEGSAAESVAVADLSVAPGVEVAEPAPATAEALVGALGGSSFAGAVPGEVAEQLVDDAARLLGEQVAAAAPSPRGLPPLPDGLRNVEVFSEFTRRTVDGEGQVDLEVYGEPTFKLVDGVWQRLVPRLARAGLGVVSEGTLVPVRFGVPGEPLVTAELPGGPLSLSPVGFTTGFPKLGLLSGDVTYRAVAPETDIRYVVTNAGVKEHIVLRGPGAPRSFRFHLADPAGQLGELVGLAGGGAVFEAPDSGSLSVVLEAPVAWEDPAGDARPPALGTSAHLSVVAAGDGFDVTVSVDEEWLAGRSFPVVLDPTISFQTGGGLPGSSLEGYAGGCLNLACDFSLKEDITLGAGSYLDVPTGQERRVRTYSVYDLKQPAAYLPDRAVIDYAEYGLYYEACIGYPTSTVPYADLCTAKGDAYTLRLDRMSQPWARTTPFSTLSGLGVASSVPSRPSGLRNSWVAWNMTSLLQSWVNFGQSGYVPNYGVQVRTTSDGSARQGGPAFNSSRYVPQPGDIGGIGSRPYFNIAYHATLPSAPTNVDAIQVFTGEGQPKNEVLVSWDRPTTGTEPSQYLVQAFDTDTGQLARNTFFPAGPCGENGWDQGAGVIRVEACGGRSSQVIAGLAGGQTYTFHVVAVTEAGYSGASNQKVVTQFLPPTLSLAPSGGQLASLAGDQATWRLTVLNPNDRPYGGTAVLLLPAGMTGVPRSVKLNSSSNPPCELVAAAGLTGADKCSHDLGLNQLVAGLAQLPANGVTTLIFDLITTAGKLVPCDVRSLVAGVQTTLGGSTAATFGTNAPVTCNGGLGLESWWSFVERPLGPGATASVNVANGNLVLQQVDTTPVQGHGQLGLVTRRTYNSQGSSSVLPLLGTDIGRGWQLNVSSAGELATLGLAGDGLLVPRDLLLTAQDSIVRPLAEASLPGVAATLVDRDGTRHTFTPNRTAVSTPLLSGGSPAELVTNLRSAIEAGAMLDLAGVVDSLEDLLGGLAGNVNLCISTSFNAPPGVHVSLWRYIVVQATGQSPCDTTQGAPSAVAAGYTVMRPDRVRENFDITGRLVSMFDRAGNELRYTYTLGGYTIWEPATCPLPGVLDPACRQVKVSSGPGTVTVLDAAGRSTLYEKTPAGNLNRVTTTFGPGPGDKEVWEYRYKDDPATPTTGCAGPLYVLCEVVAPRGGAGTRVNYNPSRQVTQLTERAGGAASTSFTYVAAAGPAPAFTDVVRDGHGARYGAIDTVGRAGSILEGIIPTPGSGTVTALRRTDYSWDSPCRLDGRADNNLCRVVADSFGAAPAGAPAGWTGSSDDDTRYSYTPQGAVAGVFHFRDLADTEGTYFGHRRTYTRPDGSTVVHTDTPTGNNTLASVPPDTSPPADALYVTEDQTSVLPPRGNDPGANVAGFLTTWSLDANETVTPGRMDPNPAGPVCGAGNSGLVCTETAPEGHVTSYSYDRFGQRATMRSPAATAGFDDGCVTPGCTTTYTYYGPGTRDLSGGTAAGGWLKAVTDPYGRFVVFGYDRAGNQVRSWDRDATTTAGAALGAYPGTVDQGPSPAYTETLYATADPYARPWRYVRSERDQLGNLTTMAVDAHGNPTAVTSPRGNTAGATGFFTTLNGFDANDRLVSTLAPAENPDRVPGTGDDRPTRYGYDANSELVSVQDPNGKYTVTVYDPAGRATQSLLTRGPFVMGVSPAGCAESSTVPERGPIPGGLALCRTVSTFDSLDQPVLVTGLADAKSYRSFRLNRLPVATFTLRDKATSAYTRTSVVYDHAGNPVSACGARQAAEEPSVPCGPGAHYGTQATFDALDRPTSMTSHRETVDNDGAKTSTWTPLVTQMAYPIAQNATVRTDPEGRTTTTVADLLDRPRSAITPRDGPTATNTATTGYSPSGDVVSVDVRATGAPAPASLTVYRFDPVHRLVDTVENPASPTAAADDNTWAATAGTNPQNSRTRLAYDPDSNIIGSWEPRAFTGSVTSPDNRFLARTDYDANGRPVAWWWPAYDDAAHTPIHPDIEPVECPTAGGAHQPAPAAGLDYPAGVGVCVSRAGYDPAGNRLTVTNPSATAPGGAGRFDSFTYTDDNLVAAVEYPDPAGAGRVSSEFRYDAAGRRVRVADPSGWSRGATWSPDGLLTASQAPAGIAPAQAAERSTTTYNADGLPVTETAVADTAGRAGAGQPDNTQTTSYYADNLPHQVTTAVTGPNAGPVTSRWGYDRAGNPTRVWSPSAVARAANNPGGLPAVNQYYDDNLLRAVFEPVAGGEHRATTFAYDPAGRETARTVNHVTGLDPAAVITPGGTQTFTWASNGWPLSEVGRDGTRIGHAYLPGGLESATTQHTPAGVLQSTVTNRYLLDGALQGTDTTATGYGTNHSGFKYTADGLPAGQFTGTDPAFADTDQAASYTYNDARALTGLTATTSTRSDTWGFGYDSRGLPTSMEGPNATATTYGYDPAGNLSSKALTIAGTATDTWAYGYDGLGRVTARTRAGSPTETYHYDQAGRVDQTSAGTVRYDPNHNRLGVGTPTVSYRADNSIAATPLGAYSYNGAGNVTGDGCRTYSYDGFDRATSTTATGSLPAGCDGATGTSTYTYDGHGRALTTVTPDEARQHRYQGTSASLWAEESTDGDRTARYTPAPGGQPLAAASSTGTYHTLHSDGQANTVLTADGGGIACRVDLDPWGNPTNTATATNPCNPGQSTPNTHWYTSAPRDPATSHYQHGQRTYNPRTATWNTPDRGTPAGTPTELSIGTDPLTANRYNYVNGDPINYTDPTGHWPWDGWKPPSFDCPLGEYDHGGCVGGSLVPEPVEDAVGAAKDAAQQGLGVIKGVAETGVGLAQGATALIADPTLVIDAVQAAVSDPLGFLYAIVEPALEDCREGNIGECVGRLGTEIGLFLVGAKGTNKGPTPRPRTGSVDDLADAARGAAGTRHLQDTPQPTARVADDLCPVNNSFVPTTPVLMAEGTTKPIADIQPGDMVMAADPETGEEGPREVTRLITGHGDKTLVDIEIDGATITATGHHPIWVNTHGQWVHAEDLQPGDYLLDENGVTLRVDGIHIRQVTDQTVHNLTVDDLHTYYVTTGHNAILTHNCAEAARAISGADDVVGSGHVTVLGRYRGGTEAFVGKPGFNVLDLPSKGTGRWYWSRNRAFLDDAVSGGDEIRLVTNPNAPLYSGGNVYQRELRYLRDLGYRFQRSGDYWVAVPGR